jgi:basic amino acid/polyamine antiporter, APA family
METKIHPGHSVKPHLSLWDIVSIIIGIVIGAGIYETAPLIFSNVTGVWSAFGVWSLGGILSLVGALCYAELACAYPRSGGDYVYLSRAYGSWAGFLFGWAQLAVIMTGSIGMMAYVFARYASRLWDLGDAAMTIYASGAVIILSLLNIANVAFGKRTQNLLSLLKVGGLALIVLVGFFWAKPGAVPPAEIITGTGSFGLAMILVLYTYGGWNDAAFVAAEMKDKQRNIPRALILGTAGVALIYLVVNTAYVRGLGFEGAQASRAIAADVLQQPFGAAGSRLMSVLVMVSALGAINGLIYTGSRIYATAGEDFRLFSALARWHPTTNSPIYSLLIQMLITLTMILMLGTGGGQAAVNAVLQMAGLSVIAWDGYSGFEMLLRCTAPVFWTFFLMTGISLFILRFKDRGRTRPFSVPFYPVLPLVFCATSIYMLYSAAQYAGSLTLVGFGPLILGGFLFLLTPRRKMETRLP